MEKFIDSMPITMKELIISCCLLVAESNTPDPYPGNTWFQQLDQNSDLLLNLHEIPPASLLHQDFKGVDTNHDDAIDQDEFNRYLILRDLT